MCDVVMPFGKYRGETLDNIPEDYLDWLLTLPDLPRELQFAVRDQLGVQDDPAWLASAARVLPRVTFEWEQVMRARHADDPAALAVVADGLAVLRSLSQDAADAAADPAADPTGLPDTMPDATAEWEIPL